MSPFAPSEDVGADVDECICGDETVIVPDAAVTVVPLLPETVNVGEVDEFAVNVVAVVEPPLIVNVP